MHCFGPWHPPKAAQLSLQLPARRSGDRPIFGAYIPFSFPRIPDGLREARKSEAISFQPYGQVPLFGFHRMYGMRDLTRQQPRNTSPDKGEIQKIGLRDVFRFILPPQSSASPVRLGISCRSRPCAKREHPLNAAICRRLKCRHVGLNNPDRA